MDDHIEEDVALVAGRGKGRAWTLLEEFANRKSNLQSSSKKLQTEIFQSNPHHFFLVEEMDLYCVNKHLTKGRVTRPKGKKVKYYTCGVNGCCKGYRTVTRLGDLNFEEDMVGGDVPFNIPIYSVEDVKEEVHEHGAVDVVNRGMKKTIFL